MHGIEPYLKYFLGSAYLEHPSSEIAQRYTLHDNSSGMYYNTPHTTVF